MKSNIKFGAFLSYVIIFLNMIIGIAYTPILTKILGQTEYGIYSMITNIISYLTILDFGFGNAIIIYTSKYIQKKDKESEEKLHGMFFIIYILIGIVAGIIGLIMVFNADTFFGKTMSENEIVRTKIMMGILTVNLVITFSFSIFTSIINAYEKFIYLKVINIIRIILNPLIMIVLLKFGFRSVALVVLTTILNVITLFLNYLYCKVKLNITFKFNYFNKLLFFEILGYSVWVFLNSIMDKINWNVDQFILGVFVGPISVAIYSIATQLTQMYLNFSTAISSVLLPKISQMEARNASDDEFSKIFIMTGRIQFIILGLIMSGFVLFGREFINIVWVGKEYDSAYIIATLLMLSITIPLIQNVGLNIIQVKNLYKYRVKVLLIFAILNIIISVLLVQKYGALGAALGTVLSEILGQIIFMNYFYYKKVNIDIIGFWKEILKISIPIFILSVLIWGIKLLFVIENTLDVLIYISIYSCLYSLFVYFFAMNNYEKGILNKLLRRG